MNFMYGFLGDFTWEAIIKTGLRISMMIVFAWVAYKEDTDHVIDIMKKVGLQKIKLSFDVHHIKTPFPHQSVYFREYSKSFNLQLLEKPQRPETATD